MKTVLGIVIAVFFTVSASAQAPHRLWAESGERWQRHEVRAAGRVNRTEAMTEKLGLDDKQAKEICKLEASQRKKYLSRMETARKRIEKDRKAAHKDFEDYDRQMKKILSAEQYSQWKAEREKGRRDMAGVRREHIHRSREAYPVHHMERRGKDVKPGEHRHNAPAGERIRPEGRR